MKKVHKLIALTLAVAMATSLFATGCNQSTKSAESNLSTASGTQKKDLKFIYICKKLTDDWFKEEEAGMKKAAAALGVSYAGIDADYKDERTMQAIDSAIAQKADGVAICASNQGLGSAIAKKLKEAGIPYLTVDDVLLDEAGNPVPYVGVPTKTAGEETATVLVKTAKERKFFEAGSKYKIMIAEMAQITTCHEMALGYKEVFMKEIPGVKESDIVMVDVKDGSFDSSIASVTAAFNANSGMDHWIIACVDDYPAYAAVKMLTENKFDFKNALVSGFGAYQQSLDIFNMGGDIKNCYFSMGLDPVSEGEKALKFLYEHVVNGTAIPMETRLGGKIISAGNMEDQFPGGKVAK